ncbi:MAG TPA: ChaB family protein [Thermoanaerobaculia bacterium]|jgi:cation transport regulator ChaB
MYDSNEDLPLVCQINLPEAAQHVYRTAYNNAWKRRNDHKYAQEQAWIAVRQQFARDPLSRRWIARAIEERKAS